MNTRKKVVKTVYEDDESESEDFSESASDAEIPEETSGGDESGDSAEDFDGSSRGKKKTVGKSRPLRREQFAKRLLSRLTQTENVDAEEETESPIFSVKDLKEEDKLLPAVLNLSESDSSDDERPFKKALPSSPRPEPSTSAASQHFSDSDSETQVTYTDVWSKNVQDSDEVAKKSFEQLKLHTEMLEETKTTLEQYQVKVQHKAADVKDLLALGEEEIEQKEEKMQDSDSGEDWEEVKDSKPLPQSGIQLVVDFPDAVTKKSKAIDVEMMMRRKINRVKKEYQVYMHKVHVLCWLGHGNYVNRVLNDQDIMAAVLTLMPSEKSYPKGRLDTTYLINISKWYRDKMTLQPDKNENKFKPKAPPLKEILLKQIKNKVVTSTKILCYIFVSLLRAIGIQCRVVFNFVSVPIRPPHSELCSLATKHKTQPDKEKPNSEQNKPVAKKTTTRKPSAKDKKTKISQIDGNVDSSCLSSTDTNSDDDMMMQLDGNDDSDEKPKKTDTRSRLSLKTKNLEASTTEDEGVSPPKRQKKASETTETKTNDLKTCKKTDSIIKPNSEFIRKSPKRSIKDTPDDPISKTLKSEDEQQSNKTRRGKNQDKDKQSANIKKKVPRHRSVTPTKVSQTKSIDMNDQKADVKTKNSDNETRENDEELVNPETNGQKKTTGQSKNNQETAKLRSKSKQNVSSKFFTQVTSTKKEVPKIQVNSKDIAKSEGKVKPPLSRKRGCTPSSSKESMMKSDDEKQSNKSNSQKQEIQDKVNQNSNIKKKHVRHINTTPTKDSETKSIDIKDQIAEVETKSSGNKTKQNGKKLVNPETNGQNRRTRQSKNNQEITKLRSKSKENVSSNFFTQSKSIKKEVPEIRVNSKDVSKPEGKLKLPLSRKRGRTSSPSTSKESISTQKVEKSRTRSAPGKSVETSKYYKNSAETKTNPSTSRVRQKQDDDSQRVSHRDLASKSPQKKTKLDVKGDLVKLVKSRMREAKGPPKEDSGSDYAPERNLKGSGDEFKLKKNISPNNRKSIDRRVLSSDDDTGKAKLKIDVWCEVFVEEVEQWISVEVFKPQVHCAEAIYSRTTHPVCYAVGWDNNNRVKDVTRRYVPAFNTLTRKQRAESPWWETALQPWRGESNHRDREEDEQLDQIMFDAPLPKSIAEYKNHPLYALKRHLLKFEALYPPEAPPLGFVRGEAVYARECVHTCRSRDTWLKEAKTVRLGEKPYKVVKARPKWDRLSNKMITDIPLEVFGPWQVQDYEPPTAQDGVVPRNAYGNVELFKNCMLPKGTVHIKLPGLNKTAKRLNIDCAPAMTGFDFHGGWTHPVFDGFVVCAEFEELITDAWVKDQEEMERKELEKVEARVYGNWRKLIKGLLIRERLQQKYAFEIPSAAKKKPKPPRFLVKK